MEKTNASLKNTEEVSEDDTGEHMDSAHWSNSMRGVLDGMIDDHRWIFRTYR